MNERLHGGTEKFSHDFSVNLNPLIKEKDLKKMLLSLATSAMRYPEERGESLVAILAKLNELNEENIVLGNGSIELFYYLPHILMPKRAFTLEPTFCEYSYICKLYNISLRQLLPKDDFLWDLSYLKNELKKGDLLFLCNPNNPTGTLFQKDDILTLAKTGAFIVVDEAFMDFSPENQSLLKVAPTLKNLVVVKSLTKIYSIAGLRLGFLVAEKQLVSSLKKILPLWNVNGIALEVAKKMLENTKIIEQTKKYVAKEKEYLLKEFDLYDKKALKPFSSNANFLLLKSEKATQLMNFAKKRGVYLRDNRGFYGIDERYFRIAIKERRENRYLLNVFREFFNGEYGD